MILDFHFFIILRFSVDYRPPLEKVTNLSRLQNVGKFLSAEEKQEIADEVKNAAYKIIERKGATYYGIGMCLVSITNAILGDENRIITVSTYDKENDVFIGLPTIVNKRGAKGRVFVDLTEEESLQLQHSIDVIKEALEKIK